MGARLVWEGRRRRLLELGGSDWGGSIRRWSRRTTTHSSRSARPCSNRTAGGAPRTVTRLRGASSRRHLRLHINAHRARNAQTLTQARPRPPRPSYHRADERRRSRPTLHHPLSRPGRAPSRLRRHPYIRQARTSIDRRPHPQPRAAGTRGTRRQRSLNPSRSRPTARPRSPTPSRRSRRLPLSDHRNSRRARPPHRHSRPNAARSTRARRRATTSCLTAV